MKFFATLKKIVSSIPALGLFLLGSAIVIEGFCVYGLFRSAAVGETNDLGIYLILIVVLGVLIAGGLIVGWFLAKR